MTTETDNTIFAAASIIAPTADLYFEGTLPEAVDVMVAYAAGTRARYGDGATSDLTMRLRNSDPDRVAEIAASALLRLAEITDLTAENERLHRDLAEARQLNDELSTLLARRS